MKVLSAIAIGFVCLGLVDAKSLSNIKKMSQLKAKLNSNIQSRVRNPQSQNRDSGFPKNILEPMLLARPVIKVDFDNGLLNILNMAEQILTFGYIVRRIIRWQWRRLRDSRSW